MAAATLSAASTLKTARAGFRRDQRQSRSAAPTGRDRIGFPSR
jgi:hypothetical protein